MRSYVVLCILCSTLPVVAQTSGAVQKHSSAASKQLTPNGVIALVNAGVSEDIIIARLRKENHPLDLSTDDLIRLKQAKVSDAIVKVMMDPTANLAPVATPVSQPQPQPIIIQTPRMAAVGAAHPSGATPAAGAAEGDVDDPLTPHDSGIYLFTKDRDGKPKMILLERAAYEGAKTGGMLGTALTYGIKKTKTRAVVPGPRANLRVTDPSPVFYFYFEDKQAGLGKSAFGVSNLSNPNQFVLLRFETKKSDRETVIGQYSALGASSGVDSKSTIPFKSERLRSGLYKVVVEDLGSGEYCFLAEGGRVMMTGPAAAYGAGATTGTDIFDFGVTRE